MLGVLILYRSSRLIHIVLNLLERVLLAFVQGFSFNSFKVRVGLIQKIVRILQLLRCLGLRNAWSDGDCRIERGAQRMCER